MAVYDNLNYTYSPGVAPEVTQYVQRAAQRRILPDLVHMKDAQQQPLPMNNGKEVLFRKFVALSAATTPLSQGVTPAGQTLTQTSFRARVKSYGAHIELTDEMTYYSISNIVRESALLLAEQAQLTIDTLCRNAFNAGLNVQYAGANASRGVLEVTDTLTYAEVKKAVRTLKRQNIKPFSDGYYHAIVHPDAVYDLTSDAMWTDVSKYQARMKVEQYELGNIYGVRFYESTNAKVFEVETYVYGTTAYITASANYDATNNEITYSTTISDDEANQMIGKLVNVQYTKSETNYVTPMCIMSVDITNKKIKFRWQPASAVTDEWTTAQTLKIVPTGAGASDIDVFSTLVYGRDSFGVIRLAGEGAVRTAVYPPGGRDDPEAQRGLASWWLKGFCAVIINDDAVVRIEHGATA